MLVISLYHTISEKCEYLKIKFMSTLLFTNVVCVGVLILILV